MKRNLKLFFIFSLIPFLLIEGCKKKDKVVYNIPSYIKQYSLFQAGSYWIYKNNKTGLMDSCFISMPPIISFNDLTGTNTALWETFNISYNSSFIAESWYMLDEYHLGLRSNHDVVCLSGNSVTPGYFHKYSGSLIFSNLFIFDTLMVDSVKHFNVLKTGYSEILNTSDTSNYFFYFEKQVGLIKLVHYRTGKDTTWNLIRYHAVQEGH